MLKTQKVYNNKIGYLT